MLDDRKSRILQSLVEEHIRTGAPVSSQAILKHGSLDVSSATIRNELAALESYGFVTQPHTSSGRVPTRQGYRYYVDHCSPGHLRVATHARIEAFFADVHREVSRLLKETSGLLTDLTRLPAVVIGPERDVGALHAVHRDRPPHDVRVRGVAPLPQALGHDHDPLRTGKALFGSDVLPWAARASRTSNMFCVRRENWICSGPSWSVTFAEP